MCRDAARLLFILIFFSLLLSGVPLRNDVFAETKPVGHLAKDVQTHQVQLTLAQRRDQAAIRGLKWMDAFLDQDDHFKTMPFETYQFFHVCAVTSANPELQNISQQAADKYMARLGKYCLEIDDPMARHDFLQLLEFISKRQYGRIEWTPLIDKAKKNYTSFKDTAGIYGTPVGDLTQADWKGVYETLLYAYFLEKVDTEFPDVFKVDYRLADILKFLKKHSYVNFADDTSVNKEKAINDTFILTHIAYMLGNYSQLRLYEQDVPWVYDYLRNNFDDILAVGHTDLIGECVDVFRSLGYTEDNSPVVRKGTEYLISHQNGDGTWGERSGEEGSAYEKMHPTSCAVWALRSRTFASGTKYADRIRKIVRELNRR